MQVFFIKKIIIEDKCTDEGAWAEHGDVVVGVDKDVDGAAWHVDGDISVAFAGFEGDEGGGACATAGGEGIAGAPFPDFDGYVVSIDNFHSLDIDTVWEEWVIFD